MQIQRIYLAQVAMAKVFARASVRLAPPNERLVTRAHPGKMSFLGRLLRRPT